MRRLAALYLLLQAAIGVAFWVVLLARPDLKERMLPAGVRTELLDAFWLADLVLVILGSLGAGLGVARARPWGWPLLCFVAGGVTYASLFFIALPFHTGAAWGGAALMAPALVLNLLFAWTLRPRI